MKRDVTSNDPYKAHTMHICLCSNWHLTEMTVLHCTASSCFRERVKNSTNNRFKNYNTNKPVMQFTNCLILAHFTTDDSVEDRKWWRERQNGIRKCHKTDLDGSCVSATAHCVRSYALTATLHLWQANKYKNEGTICYLKG